MSRPFAALVLTAGTPTRDGSVFYRPAQPIPTPVPLLHVDNTTRVQVGEVTSLTWYRHLLIAHGTTTLDGPMSWPIPVGFEPVPDGEGLPEPHPDPAETGSVRGYHHWHLAHLVVGPTVQDLPDRLRPYGRLCVAPDRDGHPRSALDHTWRLHPLRVAVGGDRHGPLSLSSASTAPSADEEMLLALYADYRLAAASSTPYAHPTVLAHPLMAEHDPLRLTRAEDGTWHYARRSWGTVSAPTRPGRTLAALLADVEDADGTLTEWVDYQSDHPDHDPHSTEQLMPGPNRDLDRVAGAVTALHLRGVDGGDYTARRDDNTHLAWTITTPYTEQDLLLTDADMAYGLLLRLAQGTHRLEPDGTDEPAQTDRTWLPVPHLSDDDGTPFEFSDGPVHRVVFVHAHHPGAVARFELGACTRPDTADHCVLTRVTLEISAGRDGDRLVYEDAQAQSLLTPAVDAPTARRFAREHRDSLRASPMTDADLWDGTRDGLEALIADGERF